NPNNPALLDVGGNIFLVRAQYEIMVAMDPQNSIQEAIRFFESARALSANRSRYALALTATLLLEAEFRFDQGLDPMPSLIRAEQLLSQGMQNRTGYFWGHHLAGDIARQKAQYALRLHTDPSPYLRHAEMCYVKSWKLGKWAESQAQLAALCVIRARWSPSRKVIDQGKEAVRIALETHPDHAEALLQLGALETAAARLASGIGKTRAKEKARATILRALQINGNLKLRAERVLP
ncbi:MAG: hypothetical protein Q8O19_00225, partial [Rectinemataceae bacterium]|nr:hypothetical protein [Rectinemataceae bacterium]